MDIENQVCSYELAKRLKELDVKQKSLFCWTTKHDVEFLPSDMRNNEICISAFTDAELGEMLPKIISIKTEDEEKKIFSNFRLVIGRSMILDQENFIEIWSINYICDTTSEFRNWLFDPLLTKSIYDENEANARAKMLIYLIENKLI